MKIQKRRKIITASMILAYVPEVLEPNALVWKLATVCDPKFRYTPGRRRFIQEKKPRDEEVRWFIIGEFKVPYMWSLDDGLWYRSTNCLDWDAVSVYALVAPTAIPVDFSSERTASSPNHLGEQEP
ncbi:MAG: hypothetical protein AAB365_00085 [Patescibacteria group bacterium]